VTTLLPEQAPWLESPALRAVILALRDHADGPRIVGGAVRDALLGLPVADIDIATILHPQQVQLQLKKAGIKAVPTGLDHGTITAVIDKQNFEITTLRRDVATDGRRATIAFATQWQDDAARRDFTINALYADPINGQVFDYFGGLDDLATRTIRFIGDPSQRIAEDHLRILRYFRFLGRFGNSDADPAAVAACRDSAQNMMALSRERIAQEISRLITLPNPVYAIELMTDNRIFAPFLPELTGDAPAKFERLVARQKGYGIAANLPARLLALLPNDAAACDIVAMRLKLSNRLRVDIANRFSESMPNEHSIRAFAYDRGIDAARDNAMLYCEDDHELAKCIAKLSDWDVPKFPIRGADLIAKGLTAGPIIAQTLQGIERQWVADDFPEGAAFTALTDQLIAGALSAIK
jgi:poly(A) polymerase